MVVFTSIKLGNRKVKHIFLAMCSSRAIRDTKRFDKPGNIVSSKVANVGKIGTVRQIGVQGTRMFLARFRNTS